MSRPTRGAWIETACIEWNYLERKSRPTRGAWIETKGKYDAHGYK